MREKKAIVVGAGIGGLTCAALLAHGGFEVVVFEKNSFIGGACSSYTRDGYTFDRGVHMFTSGLNGPFGVVLKRLGLSNLDFFKNINSRTGMKVYGMEGCFPFDINIEQLFKMMKSPGGKGEVGSGRGNSNTIGGGLKGMGLSPESFRALGNIVASVLSMGNKEIAGLYEEGMTVTQYLSRFTQDPFIHGVFAFLVAGMFAISPRKASAAEFVHCFKAEMTSKDGYQYPKGGAQAIPNAFAEGVEKFGGKIRTGVKVEKILVGESGVRGVVAAGETIEAPVVVSNLDIKMTALGLVGREHFSEEFLEKITAMKPSLSAMTFKLALKEPLIEDWGFVNLYHSSLNDWKDRYGPDAPRSNGFFGPVLSNLDPALAPPGGQTVIFGTIVPAKVPDWEKWREIYYTDLKEFYPELESRLDFMEVSFPADIAKVTGKPSGPVEGAALTPEQTGANRFSSVLPIEGLYAAGDTVGADAHGIGTQLAADSGLKCADIILAKRNSH